MTLTLEQKTQLADLLDSVRRGIVLPSIAQERAEQIALAVAGHVAEQRVVEFASTVLLASDCREHLRNTLSQYAALGLACDGPELSQEKLEHARAVIDCGVYGHLNLGRCARCGVHNDGPQTERVIDAYLYEVKS